MPWKKFAWFISFDLLSMHLTVVNFFKLCSYITRSYIAYEDERPALSRQYILVLLSARKSKTEGIQMCEDDGCFDAI